MKECQACEERPAQVELKDINDGSEEKPYELCHNCLIELVNLELNQQQFRSLIRHGHSVNEFLLHSDFYDERGRALQPRGAR